MSDAHRPKIDPYWFRPKPSMTAVEAAEKAGVQVAVAKRIWRALGLPEVSDTAVVFDERDVEALRLCFRIADTGISVDELATLARVYGKAASMIADAQMLTFRRNYLDPVLERADSQEELRELIEQPAELLLQASGELFEYARRRHLVRALEFQPQTESDEETFDMAVGFVDLVDFTRVSRDLSAMELTGLVEHFEETAIGICADHDVRVVKVIGDAVMFVSSRPTNVVQAARSILDQVEEDDTLPSARAGADFGPVSSVGGDYYGSPVNAASRITGFAKPTTLVISKDLLEAVPNGFAKTSRIRFKNLKGVRRVVLYKVYSVNPPRSDDRGPESE